uniref:N-acetyltransferase domain-containing protein n=1 Tax=Chinchilla lanigera TaxID=34839 RepID=A0A8C2W147_CHILA
RIKLGDVTPHNIKKFTRLTQVIFLLSYNSATDFYRKSGFEIETKKNYYKRIEPADAHVLQKNLKVPSGQTADAQKTDH